MKGKCDLALSCHPVLHAFPKSVHICAEVQKLNSHGAFDDRLLVISTAGIVLLAQKVLRGLHVSRVIPMVELSSIKVTNETVMFSSPTVFFTIKHDDHVKFAATVSSIHSALFSGEQLKVTIDVEKSLKSDFDEFYFPLKTESLLAERFVASLFSGRKVTFNEASMIAIYESMNKAQTKYEFTDKAAVSPFLYAIVAAVAYGDEIEKVIVNSLNFHNFFPHLDRVMKESITIKKLVFDGVVFEGHISGLDKLFDEMARAPVSEFEFRNCRFESTDIAPMFKSFAQYKTDIKELSFTKTQFCQEMLDCVFQSLFFHKCFHSLECFVIDGVTEKQQLLESLCQLATCTWVLEKYCLGTLSVTNSGMDLDILLPLLCQVDTGIRTLDLSGNVMNVPLNPKKISNFQSIVNLVLTNCKFQPGVMLSVFKCLTTHKSTICLNLSSAIMDPPAWSEFYNSIADLEITCLCGLIWDGNEIPESGSKKFVHFLKRQPNLNELSLSNCLSDTALEFLDELSTIDGLCSLSLSCTKKNALGKKLVPIIAKFLRNNNITSLNVSGQMIGDDGIDTILNGAPELNELYFDGYGPENAESMMRTCERILSSESITFALWPISDVKPALGRSPVSKRPELLKSLGALKTRFAETYGKESTGDSEVINRYLTTVAVTRTTTSTPPDTASLESSEQVETCIADNDEAMSYFTAYDEEVLSYIAECGGVSGSDPMYDVFTRVKYATQLSKLSEDVASLSS